MSRQRNDLCRLRRAGTARKSPPALPQSSVCPVSLNLRNRIRLCLLSDWQSPTGESCGPVTPTLQSRCSLRKSPFPRFGRRGSICRNSFPGSRDGSLAVQARLPFQTRPAVPARHTDVSFLNMSDQGKLKVRANSRHNSGTADGKYASLREVRMCCTRPVFHSNETGGKS